MKKVLISRDDLTQSVGCELNEEGMAKVEEIVMERNGKVSVVKKSDQVAS